MAALVQIRSTRFRALVLLAFRELSARPTSMNVFPILVKTVPPVLIRSTASLALASLVTLTLSVKPTSTNVHLILVNTVLLASML
jgi:hypothetical protein